MQHDLSNDGVSFLAGCIAQNRATEERLRRQKRDIDTSLQEVIASTERLEQRLIEAMNATGMTNLREEGLLFGLRSNPPKIIVTDETKLPDRLCRVTRKPDMAKIKNAIDNGEQVEGVTRDNGSQSIFIRSVENA